MPRVTIVIPTKDRCDLLAHTLESISAQTHTDWEAMVVDDGSSDTTVSMVTEAASHDSRIFLIENRTGTHGAPICRNLGIDASDGDFVIFLDSDDILAPHCLQNRVAALHNHSSCDFVVHSTELFEHRPGDMGILFNELHGADALYRFILYDFPWTTTGPTWRRSVLDQLRWQPSLLSGQDIDFHSQALLRNFRYTVHAEIDNFYRKHSSENTVGSIPWTSSKLPSHELRLERLNAWFLQNDQAPSRWRALWAGYHWIARKWLAEGKTERGLLLWEQAKRTAPPVIQDIGDSMLNDISPTPKQLLNSTIRMTWPEVLTISRSRTLATVSSQPGRPQPAGRAAQQTARSVRAAVAHGQYQDAVSISLRGLRRSPCSPIPWKYAAWSLGLRALGGSRMANAEDRQ